MTRKNRILFVSQEIMPFLEETEIGKITRYLPQGIQERRKEIRTFMPRYGCINERRCQLHEVVRLSGMNLIIDETDHPLIIKVASIQQVRMQVYFIDNDDYFRRKSILHDGQGGFFPDNNERIVFFNRGVLEIVKKLGWAPGIIHCHGWFASLLPLYIKTAYASNPLFSESKVVLSLYDDKYKGKMKEMERYLAFQGLDKKDMKLFKKGDWSDIMKGAITFSDAIIQGSEKIDPEIEAFAKESGKPFLPYYSTDTDDYIDIYNNFYDMLLEDIQE
ncbi:MAG: glycogen/starch synthase [Bacteroidales bacterium]|jgi:starch synthase|nr:glycogen/starch synthase [Bacteroidales bacterium]